MPDPMPANPELSSVATPSFDGDLDELLRSLKKPGNPTPPVQQSDQPGSSLSNTHQGQSGTTPEDDSSHFVDNRREGEKAEPERSSGHDAHGASQGEQIEIEGTPRSEQTRADDSVSAPTRPQNGLANGTNLTFADGDTAVKNPSTSVAALGVTGRDDIGDGPGGANANRDPVSVVEFDTAKPPSGLASVSDAGGLTHTEALTIGVTNQNEAPTDITVTGGTVQENAPAGTVVATLGATDPDAGSSFTYAISDPSGKFELVGDEIRVKAGASLDYESATSHQLSVTVTDAGGLTHTEALTIGVTNQNEAPTDITVTGGTVQENAPAGTVVATLGATDPDAGSSFAYAVSDDPSGKFELVGDEIRVKAGASLDYESATSHQLSVTVTDAGGLTHTEALTIGVTNQNEAPTDITVVGGRCRENAAAGTVVATLGAPTRMQGRHFTYAMATIPPASSSWWAMRSG